MGCSTRSVSRTPGRDVFLGQTLPRLASTIDVPIWVSVGGFCVRDYVGDVRATSTRRSRVRRVEPQLPERGRGAGIGGRDRSRLSRGDRKAALRQGFAHTPGTWARRCARSRRQEPTVSAWSTHCAASHSMRGCARRSRAARAGTPGPALKPVALAAVLRRAACDGVADRRDGRRAERTRRARADCVRGDTRRARHRVVRRRRRAVARACRARSRKRAAPASNVPRMLSASRSKPLPRPAN